MRHAVNQIYARKLSNQFMVVGGCLLVFDFLIIGFFSAMQVPTASVFLVIASIGLALGTIFNGIYFRCWPIVAIDDDYVYVKFAPARPKIKINRQDLLYVTRHERHYEVSYQTQAKSTLKQCKLPYKYFNAEGISQLHDLAMGQTSHS